MYAKKKVGITIEARMNSSRLPGKTLKQLHGRPMLARMIERLKRVKSADVIVVATTNLPDDKPIVDLAKEMGVGYYQGSSEDVLDRVLRAAKKYDIDIIVETCGDCPVIDPGIIDVEIQTFLENDVDYVACHLVKTFPIGLDAKLFTTRTLEEVADITNDPADRENVSLYIYEHPEKYTIMNIEAKGRQRRPNLRLVVDQKEDLDLIQSIYKELYDNKPDFNYDDILDLFERHPCLAELNKNSINIQVAGRDNNKMTLPRKYNAAIVGCGRIASGFDDDPLMRKNYGISTHAGAYVDNPDIELIAAADISDEKLNKFGKRWKVHKLYNDYKELLKNEQIDILSICTWNTSHLEILKEAAKRNVKAVFCEKPLSNSLENADKMVKLAEEHNISLFVDHRRRWDDLYEKIRKYIKEGHMGSIQQVSCYYTSGIANTCSHLFDVLRMFFGEIASVCAWNKNDFNKDDPDMDGYMIFQNGVTATLQSLDARYYSLFEFDIYGTKGRLRIEDNGFKISYWVMRDSSESLGYRALFNDSIPIDVLQKTIMKNAVQNIIECLSLKGVPACTGVDGVKSLEIICAFHASAKEGNIPIDLPLKRRDMMIKSK